MSKSKFSLLASLTPLRLLTLGLAGIAICTSSCSLPNREQTSVLVIAVENLGVNQLNCNRDTRTNTRSGFDLLCEESVRFTHSFTPSILSGPALASILTAQYPAVHGLRHHGRSALSNKMQTLAEVAQKKSYATSFFSGGAPILRKHNLQQGFEVFDDNFSPTLSSFFRPLSKTEPLFLNWLKDIGKQPFFSVIYAPDLMFPSTETFNDLGEARNLSLESQLEELDETLYSYFHELKVRNKWDNTLVVLVGLNGPPQKRWNVALNANLFSERSQVALLMKPTHKPRDKGITWSIDSNVTLTDLGATIWEYFAGEVPPSQIPEFETVSLKKALETTKTEWNDDRLILVESAWPEWKAEPLSPSKVIRYSLRRGHFVLMHNERPRVFNSLIDRLEVSATALTDPSVSSWAFDSLKVFEKLGWPSYVPFKDAEIARWDQLSDSTSPLLDENTKENELKDLLKKNPIDSTAQNLLAYQLLAKSDWAELAKWTDAQKLQDHPCANLVRAKNFDISEQKSCDDPLSLELAEWIRDENNDSLKRRFLRSYYYARMDENIIEANLHLQNIWDTPQKDLNSVRLIDVLLALPEVQKFSAQAQRHIQTHQKGPGL